MNKSYRLLIVITFLSVIYSCKKNATITLTPGELNLVNNGIETIQKTFYESGYDKKLVEKYNDTLDIVWKPDWDKATEKVVNDTLNYFYIAIDGEIVNKLSRKTPRNLTTINTDKYLICKLTKTNLKMEMGSFISKPITNDKSSQTVNHNTNFEKFTGVLLVKDLQNGNSYRYKYLNGVYNPLINENKNTGKLTPNGLQETNCKYFATCYWISDGTDDSYCNSQGSYSQTTGENYCLEPDNTYLGCWIHWNLSHTDFSKVCDYVYVPDPPGTPPSTGGGGTYQYDSTLKIREDSLKKHFPCATKLIIDSLSKLKDYADLVKPFTGVLKPDLTWGDQNYDWHPNGGGPTALGFTSTIGFSANINLNTNMLQNSSKLLIAATAIHETIHGYINYYIANAVDDSQYWYMDGGSWLYGLDTWYNVNGLPPNFSNHYEMLDLFFDKTVSILAGWDGNAHTVKEYRMAMLYGLDNAKDGNAYQQNLLSTEYNNILTKYGISASDMDTFYLSQLSAPTSDRLPTGGCN